MSIPCAGKATRTRGMSSISPTAETSQVWPKIMPQQEQQQPLRTHRQREPDTPHSSHNMQRMGRMPKHQPRSRPGHSKPPLPTTGKIAGAQTTKALAADMEPRTRRGKHMKDKSAIVMPWTQPMPKTDIRSVVRATTTNPGASPRRTERGVPHSTYKPTEKAPRALGLAFPAKTSEYTPPRTAP